jgi:predicted aspartyl protease
LKFGYRRYQTRNSTKFHQGIVSRPEILVEIIGPGRVVSVLALVDTGADLTLLPRSIAAKIGATVDDTIRWPVGGFGGQAIDASPGEVDLEFQGGGFAIRWKATIAFVNYPTEAEESSILGHAGFFDFFRVIFDGSAKDLEIHPIHTFPGIIN